MTADAGFNTDNSFAAKLADAKANCCLIPVSCNLNFDIFLKRHDVVLTNIHAIEKMGTTKGEDVYSILYPSDAGGQSAVGITMTHSLFKVCPVSSMSEVFYYLTEIQYTHI
jgi:hypothetical protein